MSVEVKPFQQGKLIVLSPSSNRRVEMLVDMFVAAIPGSRERLKKLRCANDFIDFVVPFGGGDVHLEFGIDPHKRFPIDVLRNTLAFGTMLAEDGATLELDLGPKRVVALPVPRVAKTLRQWRLLHEFVETLAVALFRHRRVTHVDVTMREMEEALDANKSMFAVLARPGLEMTIGPSEDCPASFQASGAMVPTCIEFGSLAYFAIVNVEAKEITKSDEGSIRFVGGQPRVVEDGVVERCEIRIAALNQRAVELGQSESSKDRWVITVTLADPDNRGDER